MSALNFNDDCTVVGASFAGLACATALARSGLRVRVLEKKTEPGEKLHTTGIIVKDAIDQIALLDGLPSELARRIDGVRLYAPCMRSIDLSAPGYYFLATDTPGVMRWLAGRAIDAGATIECRTPFVNAERIEGGFRLSGVGTTRFLIGADGPNSAVARALGLDVPALSRQACAAMVLRPFPERSRVRSVARHAAHAFRRRHRLFPSQGRIRRTRVSWHDAICARAGTSAGQ